MNEKQKPYAAKWKAEINAWLAENVMKWKRDKSLRFWLGRTGAPVAFVDTWNPFTNDADAFAVLKKCVDRKPNVDMMLGTTIHGYLIGTVELDSPDVAKPTLNEAICAFADELFKEDK